MNRPVPERPVVVSSHNQQAGIITFWAGPEVVEVLSEYGIITATAPTGNRHKMEVDPRYNFAEVLRLVEEYGQDPETAHTGLE